MSSKPKFGVDAAPLSATKQAAADQPPKRGSHPKFGVDAATAAAVKNREAMAATVTAQAVEQAAEAERREAKRNADTQAILKAFEAADARKKGIAPKSGAIRPATKSDNVLVRLFTMQPVLFWVTRYVYAILGAVWLWYVRVPVWFTVLTVLLYPFATTVLQEIGRAMHANRFVVTDAFFGHGQGEPAADTSSELLRFGLYFVFFLIKFPLSIVIGPIGLIYMLIVAKKLNN
ncbi:hypothetical protein [Lacticaseibacillus parakribbianus]|uniref:hypothetical protein n=1 Tax=Lacticaseibacillus parakribbianus TaxID=2970927 RepID=UPI0021CAFA2C|nr:hypothetical protein [Lacticaseibacillus parakribbianus]